MSHLVSADEIERAANRLSGIALRTPLVSLRTGATRLLVKAESLQPTGAFKLRGAYAAITALPEDEASRGVVAHSSGNHAHAVAYAAAVLGIPATVVVPTNAPPVKVAAVKSHGATIVRCEPSLPARLAAVQQLIEEHGYSPIEPFDHRDVIAGQGTVGLEIAADCPDVDLVLCPIGGGGLISGVASAIKAANPAALVVGVEPKLAADAADSLRSGHRVAWSAAETSQTIADALRVEQIGELPYQHMQAHLHDIVTVSDDEIRAAMRLLATGARLVAEPGGAVAVAASMFRSDQLPRARHPVAILSGGNVDPELLADVLASPRTGEQAAADSD